jgi:hypothetical protein
MLLLLPRAYVAGDDELLGGQLLDLLSLVAELREILLEPSTNTAKPSTPSCEVIAPARLRP